MNKKNNTICFVAGHSGGHILPSLTRAQQLLAEKKVDRILFFSTTAPLDKKIVEGNPVITKLILLSVRGVPYQKKILFPLFVAHLATAFFISLYQLLRNKPSSIISMGGYVSLPVCLAGWLLRIPIELYELNVEPGKAIRFLAPLAHTIWILYPQTSHYLPAHKCQLTDYPVRFSSTTHRISRKEALQALHFSPERKTIFILGGSQGSVFLNTLVREWIVQSPQFHASIQIIHQTGTHDHTDWKSFYAPLGIPAIIFNYHENLAEFYQAADLVVSRAGAGTLAELHFFQKQSLIIPLETATTHHQKYNAQAFAQKNPNLFFVLPQKDTDHSATFTTITRLLQLN
jgi:UDP-N-acetylglucosamine--N-acetylmuramyl-(pentapeptide) pyrophosphoryl-undecaprenol N-acetylglucosamine transferase